MATPTPQAMPQHKPASYAGIVWVCDVLDDIEKVRIANANRLAQLMRNGITTGIAVDFLRNIVDGLMEDEKDTIHRLEIEIKYHPLGAWISGTPGVGMKQGARLLGSIGDPAWNNAEKRLRRGPAELWRYCGYDVLDDGTAPRRRRGQKSHWNPEAKMRAYLVAESCIKQKTSPYREVYERRREKTQERLHKTLCIRCGPSGKPAAPGTKWSAGHQHADALRVVAKEILKDLFLQARRLRAEGKTV